MDNERKCFVHMLGVLIMGTDIVLDYVQIRNYWRSGADTRDLFVVSVIVMTIVPLILSFYLALIFTNSKAIYLYRGIFAETDDDVFSGMVAIPGIARVLAGPTCTPCLGLVGLSMSMAADIFMFMFLFVLFFPFMFVVVTLTPIAGLFIGWRDMQSSDLKRYYLIRYLNGPFEALPQMVINSIYINRSSKVTGTSVASIVFSVVSICQVIHQALGLGKYTCCGETGPRVFSGSGTFFETINHDV